MSNPYVEAFAFDDLNEEKINAHHLNITQVDEILTHKHIIIPNRKSRTGLFLILGRDDGGSCIAAPIEQTPDDGVWRPITAWQCKRGELTLLMKSEGVK